MESYTANGLVFDVTDAGPADGELIVLLHGYPETRASWEGTIPLLAEAGYRVLAPDQRGYSPGARPPGRRAYRLEHLVGDVVALANAAEADRIHVVGHDWGGAVAWALAAWHPERLHSMTSLATPHPRAMMRAMLTSSQALHSWYMLFFQLPRLPEMGITGPGQRLFRRTLRRSGLPDASIDRYLAVLSQPGAATGALNWYRALPFVPPSKMPPVAVPALYLYGTGDFALGRKAAELTARYVRGPYRFEVLEGVSHWIPEEVPDRVAALVIEHARAYGGRTG
jgi:pimeloyl-ACP methyl ester carboxylesterase